MKNLVIVRQSLGAILRHKGRSALTVLGIVIGVGAVIALVGVGAGVNRQVAGSIASLGASTLRVFPGGGVQTGPSNARQSGQAAPVSSRGFGPTASTLSQKDLTTLVSPHIAAVSAEEGLGTILAVQGQPRRIMAVGVSEPYFGMAHLRAQSGRLIEGQDIDSGKVAVMGHRLAADLYGSHPAVGQTVTIAGVPFEVVGVLAQAQETGFENPNFQIFIPYPAVLGALDTTMLSRIVIQAKSQAVVDAARADVQSILLKNHGIAREDLADFTVLSAKDVLQAIMSVNNVLSALLAGIAAISLVVGGIGIMNIMLVSVTERTREIGLRKAVGARTSDILGQFIVEAVLLTLLGGLLGIGLGILLGNVAAQFIGTQAVITPGAVVLAVGVSCVTGLVFGIYPAAKAARLDAIEALRYE